MKNKLIEISSLIYITIALLIITYIPLIGGIYLGIGIILLSYSFLNEEEIKKQKTSILLLAIISIITNFPVSILLFIAYSNIETNKIKESISTENKRLDILLKIGLAMILISGVLFATTNWETIPSIVKCLGLILIGIMFVSLSNLSEQKLKIKKTTKSYFILGLFFFLLSFVGMFLYGTISEWLTYSGDGSGLAYFISYTLLSILLYVIYNKFKDTEYKYISFICCFISLYHLLAFIGLNIELILLVISSIIFILNILIKNNDNSIAKIIITSNYVLWPLLITHNSTNFNIIIIIASLLNMTSIIYSTQHKKDTFYEIISIIISCILLTNISIRLEFGDLSTTLFIIFTIFYLYITYYKKQNSIYLKNTNQVMYNIITSITILTTTNNSIKFLICSLIYCIINIINCYVTNAKDSKFDLYYQPIIILITINSILQIFSDFINVDFISPTIICGIIYTIIHYLIKNTKIKKLYLISTIIITILSVLINIYNNNIIDGIFIILLFSYIYYNNKNSWFAYVSLPISIILLKNNIVYNYDMEIISNIITILILTILTFLFNKNDKFTKTNLLIMIIPIYSLILNFDIDNNIKLILMNLSYIYILALCIYLFVKSPKTKDILYTIFMSLILLNIIMTNNILIGLYVGIVSISIIIMTYNKKEYKSFFYCGVAFTILNIIIQIGEYWGMFPLWAYLLLGGLIIVSIVTIKEIKKQKELPEETNVKETESQPEIINIETKQEKHEETPKTEVNNSEIKVMNFCPSCGAKNNGDNFCKKCGNKLIK